MSWIPSTRITEARTRLLESATFATTLGIKSGQVHYPQADPTDPLPLCILQRAVTRITRAGNGSTTVGGVIHGVLVVSAAIVTDGDLEEYGELIGAEIVGLLTDGIFIKSLEFSRTGAPGPGFWAANDEGQPEGAAKVHSTLTFVMEWGDS